MKGTYPTDKGQLHSGMAQKDIIAPIDPAILRAELREQLMLRRTNRAGNEIYTFRAEECPNTMLELGRLREEAFRFYGGGTGKPADIDQFDLDPRGYRQLIVWDPKDLQIIGGYRYILGKEVVVSGTKTNLASNEIYNYSKHFLQDYLPKCIELGRSFVRTDYQQAGLSPKSLFALDNLWDGLGALILIHDDYKYFFGKVTMYKTYDRTARDLIIYYLKTYFKGEEEMMTPTESPQFETDISYLRSIVTGRDAKADFKAMNRAVREQGVNIPPLVNAYMGLSSDMKVFDPSINRDFSDVEETAIMIPFDEIAENKKKRHVESFLRDASKSIRPNIIRSIKKRLGVVSGSGRIRPNDIEHKTFNNDSE